MNFCRNPQRIGCNNSLMAGAEIYPVTSSAVTNARIASHLWDFGCNRFDAK
jgi:hypothetical protein